MTAPHKEFTEAGEATRSAYYYNASVEQVNHMRETAPMINWPISGDQLAVLKADTKNREVKNALTKQEIATVLSNGAATPTKASVDALHKLANGEIN